MIKKTNMMIAMHLIYSIFKSFILIFVNIHLWKTGKSIEIVALFNIFNYAAATASFYLANLVALKNLRYNYFLSSLSFMLVFFMTALLGSDIIKYAILIGILGGCGDGFFFFNLNTFQAEKLPPDAMDRFMSISGALNKASSIVTPLVSGFVIEVLGFNAMVYALILLIGIQIYLAFHIESHNVTSRARVDLSALRINKNHVRMLMTNTIISPYTQFTAMTGSVFLYTLVASESIIGILNASFSLFSILMFTIYRLLQRKMKRNLLMLIGAIASSVVLTLLLTPNLLTFILFGLLIAVGGSMFQAPLVGVQLSATKEYATDEAQMLGNLFMRVFMLNFGRIVFFIFVFAFYKDFTSSIFTYFLIYNMIAPMAAYLLGRNSINRY